jgi:hypothetical protein
MSKFSSHSASGHDRGTARLLYGVGGIAFAALLAAWTYTTHANPKVTIPNPALPTPNAFDLYLAAGKALVAERPLEARLKTAFSAALSIVCDFR